MGMCAAERRYTADDLADMPDDTNRYEVIGGVLCVTPAPFVPHQRAQMELFWLLRPYVDALGLELFGAPTAVRASSHTEVQPDVLVLDPARLDPEEERFFPMPTLLLATEILSRSTRHRDRGIKRRTYLGNGVAEYWIVDLSRRTVDVWRQGAASAEVRADTLIWQPLATHVPLVVDLHAYFALVLDRP